MGRRSKAATLDPDDKRIEPMYNWILPALTAGLAVVGMVGALLLVRIDDAAKVELGPGDEEQHWTSIL